MSLFHVREDDEQELVHLIVNQNLTKLRRHLMGVSKDFLNKSLVDGKTFLHLAVESGSVGIVEALVKAGTDVNLRMDNPFVRDSGSALHLAVSKGHYEIVKLLIDSGASLDITDSYKRTPRQIDRNGLIDRACQNNSAWLPGPPQPTASRNSFTSSPSPPGRPPGQARSCDGDIPGLSSWQDRPHSAEFFWDAPPKNAGSDGAIVGGLAPVPEKESKPLLVFEDLSAKVKTVGEELIRAEQDAESLKARMEPLQARSRSLLGRVDHATMSADALADKIQNLRLQLQKEEGLLLAAESEVRVEKEALESVTGELKKLERRATLKDGNVEHLKEELNVLKKELEVRRDAAAFYNATFLAEASAENSIVGSDISKNFLVELENEEIDIRELKSCRVRRCQDTAIVHTLWESLDPLQQWNIILGVPKTANREQINRQFKRLSWRYHPDKNGMYYENAGQMMQLLKTAYEIALS